MNILNKNSLLISEAPVFKKTSQKKAETRQKVKILWTGGFDSTFRMVQLSRLKVDIQPYYVTDERKSEELELKAISAITKDIVNHPETKCVVHPLIIYKTSDIEPDKLLTESYNKLYKKNLLGSQYDWLGRFAKMVPGLELCLEKSDTSKAYKCILANGRVLKVKDKALSHYIIDENNSDPDFYRVFKNYRLPYPLFTITKLQMVEEFKRLGFEDTMTKTWFCHSPFKEEPCGVCNPCKSVIEEGLAFRIPPQGLKRYKYYLKYGDKWWYNKALKIQRLIAGFS